MAISIMMKRYLDRRKIDYDIIKHSYTENSLDAANAANVPPERIAKCVVLEDEGGYMMAVCPASNKIKLGELFREINRKLQFASEYEIADEIGDCVFGAIPPLGEIYDMEVVVDDSLFMEPDIYFEAGDHEDLVHVEANMFRQLMRNADHALFSHPV